MLPPGTPEGSRSVRLVRSGAPPVLTAFWDTTPISNNTRLTLIFQASDQPLSVVVVPPATILIVRLHRGAARCCRCSSSPNTATVKTTPSVMPLQKTSHLSQNPYRV